MPLLWGLSWDVNKKKLKKRALSVGNSMKRDVKDSLTKKLKEGLARNRSSKSNGN